MKKVAFLICSDTIGGHEFQSLEFAKTASRYAEVTVIFNNRRQYDLINHSEIKKLELSNFFKYGNFIYQYFIGFVNFFKLRHLLVEYDQIIVCAGTVEAGISTGIALWSEKIHIYVPMFVDRELLWGKIGMIYNTISHLFTLPYKSVVTINEFQAKLFDYKRVSILPNYVSEISGKINIKTGKKRLYFIGRFENQKRLLELISWLDNEQNPYDEFVLVGDGSEKHLLTQKANTVSNIRITFKGWLNRAEQEDTFTADDTFILNSAYEGDPLVIREANNRCSTVIARDIIGVMGCTHESNRYKNQKELIELLKKSYNNLLPKYRNLPVNEIEILRNEIVREIFI
ncbi:glycosyltransferase [Pedobacter aquatilis]|uniref:glycosyltransferase n=1 Tax=Pedobacter aquatilis TaxID=351343 RepID=UPI0029309A2D|nr:glycosyltransferase [Pedobacter aquatilis]